MASYKFVAANDCVFNAGSKNMCANVHRNFLWFFSSYGFLMYASLPKTHIGLLCQFGGSEHSSKNILVFDVDDMIF